MWLPKVDNSVSYTGEDAKYVELQYRVEFSVTFLVLQASLIFVICTASNTRPPTPRLPVAAAPYKWTCVQQSLSPRHVCVEVDRESRALNIAADQFPGDPQSELDVSVIQGSGATGPTSHE
eukprot:72591-Prymnesium_polylepis.1